MRPYDGTQALLRETTSANEFSVLGSCFMILGSKRLILTAHHCVKDIPVKEMRIGLSWTRPLNFNCVEIYTHPSADIALVQVDNDIPKGIRRRALPEDRARLGMHLQCYGLTADYGGRTNREFRLVEGVVQRHLHYIDDPMHKTPAIELSAPIPKGMSGAPAFFAQGNDVVFGLAIGSKQSAIVDYEYEHVLKNGHENHVLRERIAEYGLVADMFEVKEWLIDMHREHD